MNDLPDINITINAGAALLTATLEDAHIATGEIGQLAGYFRWLIPNEGADAIVNNGALVSALDLISRVAKQTEATLESLCAIAQNAAMEVAE